MFLLRSLYAIRVTLIQPHTSKRSLIFWLTNPFVCFYWIFEQLKSNVIAADDWWWIRRQGMDAVHDYIGLRLEFSGETFLDIRGHAQAAEAIGPGGSVRPIFLAPLKPNSTMLSGRRQVRSWLQTCSELKFGLSSSLLAVN